MTNKVLFLSLVSIAVILSWCTDQSSSITLEEVAKHNTKEDCWMVLYDKVYNVTSFIKDHPGGDALLLGCGKDGTQLYETRPMGSGTPHSGEARNMLLKLASTVEGFYIGDLRK